LADAILGWLKLIDNNLYKKIIFVFFISAIYIPFFYMQVSAQVSATSLILDGMHKFSPEDNPVYALPSFDDSQWKPVTIPGSWQSQGIEPEENVGWYRIHFTVHGAQYSRLALLLGRIGDADEVFLNGIKIGEEGVIGKRFVEATKVVRLYEIPHDLLKYHGTNVIAVRVLNTYLNGGIFDAGVTVGDYNTLLITKLKRDKTIGIAEFCFFTFFAIFFVTCFFFYIKGLRDKEYIYFWLFISLYAMLFVLGSLSFYNAGFKTPYIQQIINSISTLIPASLVLLLIYVYQKKFNIYIKSLLLTFFTIALINALYPVYVLKHFLYNVWKVTFIATAAFTVFLAVKAYLKKAYESAPILLGITGLVIGFILESIGGLDLLQITGFFLWDYSVAFFMICIMYALTARYMRIKELQSASVRIFKAHEDERKRLAREIHDGVGPSLLSIKLRLQMLEAQAKAGNQVEGESLSELLSEVTNTTEELRAVAMDLRPSFLENIDIIDAIRWHAEKLQERLGMQINVTTDGMTDIDSKMKDTIYRIYQETLSNAVKHSEATAVDIVLRMDGNFFSLEVKDNGKGFDPAHAETTEEGMGLSTIRERVELLGGILRIKSSDTMGTSVSIEVPVE
jgi:signal transduction histidine kinase